MKIRQLIEQKVNAAGFDGASYVEIFQKVVEKCCECSVDLNGRLDEDAANYDRQFMCLLDYTIANVIEDAKHD